MIKTAFRQVAAFLRRDLLTETSYKFAFASGALYSLMNIFVFYFIDKLFGHRMTAHLEVFNTGYFSYVFLSTAFFNYAGAGLGSFSAKIRAEQYQGTLEAVLATPVGVPTLLFSLCAWNFLYATFELAVYVLLGLFVFKINVAGANIPACAAIFAVSVVCFSSLGVMSACFTLIFKRGNPIGWLIAGLEGLFCGVFFPVTVLPRWLGLAAKFIPVTHAIKALELSVYRGYSITELKTEIALLAAFAALSAPLSVYLFKYAVGRTLRDGDLGQY